MTARKYAQSPTKTPAITAGDDRPRAACDRAWTPFEVLMHETRGPGFRVAVNEARAICGLAVNEAGELVTTPDTCPLLATCLLDNDEPWARAILGLETRKDPIDREFCGSARGMKYHAANNEKPCETCAQWNREKVARWAKKKREAAA